MERDGREKGRAKGRKKKRIKNGEKKWNKIKEDGTKDREGKE
jgi:hypothetical protein